MKATNYIFFIFFLHLPMLGRAQSTLQVIGGASQDFGFDICNTSDGGWITCGETYSFGAGTNDVYVVKHNVSGTMQWTRTFGGLNAEFSYSIKQTTDGGYVVAGTTWSYGAGGSDVYVIKMDNGGNVTWTSSIGGTGYDFGRSIIQTTDGGYAIVGTSGSYDPSGSQDVYFVKLDASGNVTATASIGGHDNWWDIDNGFSVGQTADGGYLIGGISNSYDPAFIYPSGIYLIKLDATFNLVWTKIQYISTGAFNEVNMTLTSDGGCIVSGTFLLDPPSGFGNYDGCLAKFDNTGTLQWSRVYGGTGMDYCNSVIQTSDGGYAVAGTTNTVGEYQGWFIKVNNTGIIQYTRTIGGAGSDNFKSVCQLPTGGYALTGIYENGGVFIATLDAAANICAGFGTFGSSASVTGPFLTGGALLTGGNSGSGGIQSSGGAVINQCIILPIELLEFKTVCENSVTKLNWTTASEINNDFFTIEQSSNAIDWNVIDNVSGAGMSSTILNYSYEIENDVSGTQYYRLKQTDFDGNFEYFDIITSNCDLGNDEILVFPNPVANSLNLMINFEEPVATEIQIINSLGQILYNKPHEFSEGNNYHEIDISYLASGFYLVHVTYNGNKIMQKKILKS